MTYKNSPSRIFTFAGIFLTLFLLCQAPPLAAQSQPVAAFPHSASWGDTPAQVAAAKGPPHNPLEGE
ncbi:MAG: hypothetical protein LBV79_10730, partial [Candidatus Adiutrix sp.]|nr:hypothetical protein [Candidatus Adiutrix sp.]